MTEKLPTEQEATVSNQIRFKVRDYVHNYALMVGKPLTRKQLNSARKCYVNAKTVFESKGIEFDKNELLTAFAMNGKWLTDSRPDTSSVLESEAEKLLAKIA